MAFNNEIAVLVAVADKYGKGNLYFYSKPSNKIEVIMLTGDNENTARQSVKRKVPKTS